MQFDGLVLNNQGAPYLPINQNLNNIDPILQTALDQIGIQQADLDDLELQPLLDIIRKELNQCCHISWATVDNFIEQLLQGLLISRRDLRQGNLHCCRDLLTDWARQMPHGRSLWLQHDWGLKKTVAARSFIHTTDSIVSLSVTLFIGIALSYRFIELVTTGFSDFAEFRAVFQTNRQRGITSLVKLLSNVDPAWLKLILASPFLLGTLKSLWDGCKNQQLKPESLIDLHFAVQEHIKPLDSRRKKFHSYFWRDSIRQLLPIPCSDSLTDRVQKAEKYIRWDGRDTIEKRTNMFTQIERVAFQAHGLTRLNAMQSLAKIVHSLSIKDFAKLRGYPKPALLQILKIKSQALKDLRILAGQVLPEADNPPRPSHVSKLYATYLICWLGMANFKQTGIFLAYKAASLTLQALCIKEFIDTLIEAINCPDRPGFKMFYGEYEIWANQLTTDCFREFVRQFRLLSKEEPFNPFLEQLKNFHLDGLDSIDLAHKALTANETKAILDVLNPKMTMKNLDLSNNRIGYNVKGIQFSPDLLSLRLSLNRIGKGIQDLNLPQGLLSLDLLGNDIGEYAKGLKLPSTLQWLSLAMNDIDSNSAKDLRFPESLKTLYLIANNISHVGAKALRFPSNLEKLDLSVTFLDDEGAKALQLPPKLITLSLDSNKIGPKGVKWLKLPQTLLNLSLSNNEIGKGAQNLTLPLSLQKLELSKNSLGDAGAGNLRLPLGLQILDIGDNSIGNVGAKNLQLPSSLQELNLGHNNISTTGFEGLKLPSSLTVLYLHNNRISNCQGVQLPPNLVKLFLSSNLLGNEGAKQLKFPKSLRILNLAQNGLGSKSTEGLQFPKDLDILTLDHNQIGDEGLQTLQLPPKLSELSLVGNQIGDGIRVLILPETLQELSLSVNKIGPQGAIHLNLPRKLRILSLTQNQIGDVGAKGLRLLNTSLVDLSLETNQIGAMGSQNIKLPPTLKSLRLNNNPIGEDGAQGLQLPSTLQYLTLDNCKIGSKGASGLSLLHTNLKDLILDNNNIGNEGVKGLQLPTSLESLYVKTNQIGDDGVKELFKKISQTHLNFISLDGNNFNQSAFNTQRELQQQILLRHCQDQLCHSNTPLLEDPFHTTSSASRTQSIFSWLRKPVESLLKRVDRCFTSALNKVTSSLKNTLSDSPSYFPNIDSPVWHDFHSPGPLESSYGQATMLPEQALEQASAHQSLLQLGYVRV